MSYTYTGRQLHSVQEEETTYARYSGFNAVGQPRTQTYRCQRQLAPESGRWNMTWREKLWSGGRVISTEAKIYVYVPLSNGTG